jgi:hypothetical protein
VVAVYLHHLFLQRGRERGGERERKSGKAANPSTGQATPHPYKRHTQRLPTDSPLRLILLPCRWRFPSDEYEILEVEGSTVGRPGQIVVEKVDIDYMI